MELQPNQVSLPAAQSPDDDYETVAGKALTLQSKRKSAADLANIWIRMGLEKKENLSQYEENLRNQTPTFSEREVESELRREKHRIKFCGLQAHAELDRAEKLEAEYKENFDRYEAALKRYRIEQEKGRFAR
jgi:hypothetical protein